VLLAYKEKGAYEGKKVKWAYEGQNEGNRPLKLFSAPKVSKSA
jgi:hypothetical protein